MYHCSDDGCGLAAPQVGVNVRMMVFNETGDKSRKNSEIVLVNPRIISSSKDKKIFEEGCLSFPKIYGDVVVCSVYINIDVESSKCVEIVGAVFCPLVVVYVVLQCI